MTAPPRPPDPLAQSLGAALATQYELVRELGRGGMGVVYLAREVSLDREVAIKVLPPDLARDPVLRQRFLREARTAAQLSHPNIVPIHRADEAAGHPFFAMGYVEGESLAERVRARGPLAAGDAVRILREVAWALAYAHARGVVHRDVKAENILLDRATGRAVVTDFGIARDARTATSLTETGMVMGSVHYMSPEQVAGEAVDGRSDLYSLGVVGFLVLAGRLPFDDAAATRVLVRHATEAAPELRSVAPDVPPRLAQVIQRCLAKDPGERYPTGEALAEALEQALDRGTTPPAGLTADAVVTEQAAAAIWARAAQLQAEAATRIRERAQQAGLPAAEAPVGGGAPTTGYRLRDVEAAAVEAGISAEFVQLALAELPPGPADAPALDARRDRLATYLLGTSQRSFSVSRVVGASPRRTLEALGRTAQAHPYNLTLADTVGGHPLDGGILLFNVPQMVVAGESTVNMFGYRMAVIDQDQVRVALHPLRSDPNACEVVVYGDLRSGIRKNFNAARWTTGITGAVGAAATGAIVAAKTALGAALAGPIGIGAGLVLGAAAALAYRAAFRSGLRHVVEEIEGLLGAIQASVRSEAVFGTAPPPRLPPQRPPEDDGGAAAAVLLSG